MTHSVLGVILIQILISCQIGSIQSAPLSSYLVSSFTPPDSDFKLPFNHIAFNNITGDIYIGARERLYQLDSGLNLKETVDTGKCSSDNEGNSNDNKLLLSVVTPQNYTLITCGGCGDNCQIRNLANISLDVRCPTNTGDVVATGDLPTVAVVAIGNDFASSGMDQPGSFLFNGISGTGGTTLLTFISKRSLVDLKETQSIPLSFIKSDYSQSFQHLISYNDYLYYFISRNKESYLGRICRESPDQVFESYTEIELQCGHDGSQNVIQSAYIGPAGSELADSMNISTEDGVLYAIFLSSSSSSLCVYTMIDVQQSFEDAILGCIQGTGTGIANSFMSDNPNSKSKCEKLNIVNSSFGYVYEDVFLGGGSVLQEMFLYESKGRITLATSSDLNSTQNRVVTIDLVNCGQYQTCEECIGENGGNDGDPYCGWCTLEANCTRYEECTFPDESTRWLSYNAIQCVSVSDVQPDHRLPYQITQEITITVQQLPTLNDNHRYQCAFDSYLANAVTTSDTVVCTTPPVDELPTIPEEEI
nr:plexin-B2-like [Lytechinus pictus]